MAMKSRPWCSICRSYYRGIYPVHASTARHQANARRQHTPAGGHRGDLNRALGIPRVDVARMLRGDTGSDRETVRAHRRRLPEDGPRFVVGVRRYTRREVWHPTRLPF